MSDFKVPVGRGDGKPAAKAGKLAKAPVVKVPVVKAARSAIVMNDAPEPTLSELIESAVAPVAPAVAPDASMAPAPAPSASIAPAPVAAVAAAEPVAAPVPVAAPEAEPAIAAAAEPEDVRSTDPAGAIRPAPTPSRGIFDMATTFETANPAIAAEKVKAVFGGLNDRAKTAMEKSAKLGGELGELTKGNVEALVASGKVAAKGAESLAQEAVEYGKKNFETATTMFKSLAGAKSPTELFQLQSEFAKSSFDSAVAEASKLSEAWVKLAGEMVQPLSSRYAVAAEKLKSAAM